MSTWTPPRCLRRAFAALLISLAAVPAHATIFTVGAPGAGCTHEGIQDAINAAHANPGADTVRITRTQAYVAQQVVAMNLTEDLNIVGGFANCASTVSDGTQTIVSGAGGDSLPVFNLRAPAGVTIKFRLLRITAGDQDGDGSGGGINYIGGGLVELIETTVDDNVAAYGGGIYFNGTSEQAELRISNDVLVSSNEAAVSGGGVYLYGGSMTMNAPRSSLAFNRATQFGGGLRVLGSAAGTEARIGSGGSPGLATIEGNEAAQGGGISVSAPDVGDTEASLDLQTVDPSAPTRIVRNVASLYGGAIHLQNHHEDLDFGFVSAALVNTELDGNRAPDAAAVLLGTGTDDEVPIGAGFTMTGGRMTDNAARTVMGATTNGALIVARAGAGLLLRRVRIDENESGPLIHARNAKRVVVEDSLIHTNIVRGPLFEILDQPNTFQLFGSTIVDNAMSDGGRPNAPVIFATKAVNLLRMVIWQPGRTTLESDTAQTDDVLASEINSLSPGGTYAIDAPRFLDPEMGDYRLQAASPAVDFSSLVDGNDLNGVARNIDVDRVVDLEGRGDLGAFERQTLGNLVLNPGFAADLRRWTIGTPGVDATRQLFGESSLGAATLSLQSAPGGEFTGFVQCVRIPGPGVWRLSGFAFGAGGDPFTRDIPSIRWRLLPNTGDESCGGALGAEGNIGFANAATYTQGETVIDVPEASWTPYTAIEIQLRVREGSININATTTGHFDGIVLEASALPASTLPFADGFE